MLAHPARWTGYAVSSCLLVTPQPTTTRSLNASPAVTLDLLAPIDQEIPRWVDNLVSSRTLESLHNWRQVKYPQLS